MQPAACALPVPASLTALPPTTRIQSAHRPLQHIHQPDMRPTFVMASSVSSCRAITASRSAACPSAPMKRAQAGSSTCGRGIAPALGQLCVSASLCCLPRSVRALYAAAPSGTCSAPHARAGTGAAPWGRPPSTLAHLEDDVVLQAGHELRHLGALGVEVAQHGRHLHA